MTEPNEEIPPGTEILDAIRAERSPFASWAGEVLDNSFDASATVINLTMTDSMLRARDNGDGITRKKDTASVKIGGHADHIGTKLGRFGIGIKYKSIQHGNIYQIVSVSEDGHLDRQVDWSRIRQLGKWIYPPAMRSLAATGTPTGTTITIRSLLRAPKPVDITKTHNEIARKYYPALEGTASILLNGERIMPLEYPKLTQEVFGEQRFPHGRSATIRGGVISGDSKLRQVDLVVGFRVIRAESPFGCDGYNGIRSMFARIDLHGPWKITKFKDDFSDDEPYQVELEEWAEEILRPVLEHCHSASMFLNTKKLEDMLNEMLPEQHRMARPKKRNELGRQGTKDGRQGKADAEPEDRGPARKKNPPRGIQIEFADGLNEDYGYGRAQFGKSCRIQLASDNPHVRFLMSSRDLSIAKVGLYGIACMIFEGDLRKDQPNLFADPIGLSAWKMVKNQDIPEAAATLAE